MKKRILSSLFVGISVIGLTACGTDKEVAKSFTITCKGEDSSIEGVKQTNKSVYKFDKNQYVTEYEINTTSVYKDEETYKTYKESSKETIESNANSKVVYDFDTNDKKKTIKFNYKIKITTEDLKEVEDKNYYKAVKVLERAEANPNAKCSFDGIKRSQIK